MGERRRWIARGLGRRRSAVAALGVLIVMASSCFLTLGWSSQRMAADDLDVVRRPPGAEHVLGTDDLGRDVLARMSYGGAISLSLGLVSAAIAVLFGTAYGAFAGYVGGRVDEVLMRLVDVLYALPYMLLVMLLAVSLGARLEGWGMAGGWARFVVLALAIGGVSWLTVARVVRGQVLSLREQPFVEAARAIGVPGWRILVAHILPNTLGPIVVFAALAVPQAILQESFLSFLGVGIQPPQATWGSLAADGVQALNPVQFDWWLVVFPCLALAVTLVCLNVVGEGLREAFDVRSAE